MILYYDENIYNPVKDFLERDREIRKQVFQSANPGLLEAAVNDYRSSPPQLLYQSFSKFPFAVSSGIGKKLVVARLSGNAVPVVETELSKNLPMATMAGVDWQNRRDCLEIQIVTGSGERA